MKLLIMSDTHGDTYYAEKAMEKHKHEIAMVIHLGDYFRDAQRLNELYSGIKFEYVYGNSDFMIGDVPAEKLLEIEGKKLFITHGHRYSVKWGNDKIIAKAESMKIDLFLFGHTHIAEYKDMGGYAILNPGSISSPRGEQDESYAMVEIKDGQIYVEIRTV